MFDFIFDLILGKTTPEEEAKKLAFWNTFFPKANPDNVATWKRVEQEVANRTPKYKPHPIARPVSDAQLKEEWEEDEQKFRDRHAAELKAIKHAAKGTSEQGKPQSGNTHGAVFFGESYGFGRISKGHWITQKRDSKGRFSR